MILFKPGYLSEKLSCSGQMVIPIADETWNIAYRDAVCNTS
jgi:hypothetical protein